MPTETLNTSTPIVTHELLISKDCPVLRDKAKVKEVIDLLPSDARITNFKDSLICPGWLAIEFVAPSIMHAGISKRFRVRESLTLEECFSRNPKI